MITVLGAKGFIGSHLVNRLASLGRAFKAPQRLDGLDGEDLGDVIYCIGLTADFRDRPVDTVEAHVCKLLDIQRNLRYETFLYLSSTRLYGLENGLVQEDGQLRVDPGNLGDLYNISKIMGESLLRASGRPVRIARLSNVYGADFSSENFLSAVIKQAVKTKRVTLENTLESEKDFIHIDDVVDLLIKIASGGQQVVYNVASGINASNRQIMERLATLTNCQVEVRHDARTVKFPPINVERICSEFDYHPRGLLAELENLVDLYANCHGDYLS